MNDLTALRAAEALEKARWLDEEIVNRLGLAASMDAGAWFLHMRKTQVAELSAKYAKAKRRLDRAVTRLTNRIGRMERET